MATKEGGVRLCRFQQHTIHLARLLQLHTDREAYATSSLTLCSPLFPSAPMDEDTDVPLTIVTCLFTLFPSLLFASPCCLRMYCRTPVRLLTTHVSVVQQQADQRAPLPTHQQRSIPSSTEHAEGRPSHAALQFEIRTPLWSPSSRPLTLLFVHFRQNRIAGRWSTTVVWDQRLPTNSRMIGRRALSALPTNACEEVECQRAAQHAVCANLLLCSDGVLREGRTKAEQHRGPPLATHFPSSIPLLSRQSTHAYCAPPRCYCCCSCCSFAGHFPYRKISALQCTSHSTSLTLNNRYGIAEQVGTGVQFFSAEFGVIQKDDNQIWSRWVPWSTRAEIAEPSRRSVVQFGPSPRRAQSVVPAVFLVRLRLPPLRPVPTCHRWYAGRQGLGVVFELQQLLNTTAILRTCWPALWTNHRWTLYRHDHSGCQAKQ